MRKYSHYSTELNKQVTASFENEQKEIQKKPKPNFFSAFCCIGFGDEEQNENVMEKKYSSLSMSKSILESINNENVFEKEIQDKNIKIFNSEEDCFPSVAKLKKVDLNRSRHCQITSEFSLLVQEETILQYFENKYFKGNILLSLLCPNGKIVEKALQHCDNVFLQIDEDLINSNEMKSIIHLIHQFDNGNLIISKQFSIHSNSLIDKMIIFFSNEKSIENQLIMKKVIQMIKFTSQKSQQDIDKLIFIFPPNFDFNELQNILCYENMKFYQKFENEKWLEKIIDPENYTYTYQNKNQGQNQKVTFHQRQLSSKPKFRICDQNQQDFNYNCKSFLKYNKISGIYLNQQLQCIQLSFKIKVGNCLQKQNSSIITCLKEKIFFLNEISQNSKFTNDQNSILEDLITSSPLISCLQAIKNIIHEQISFISLKNQISHLRYLTILIGSGMIQNSQDLNALQYILFEVCYLPIVNLNITPPTSPHQYRMPSNLTGKIAKKQKSLEGAENFDGYSYDLSQIDKRTNQEIIEDNLEGSYLYNLGKFKRIVSVTNLTSRHQNRDSSSKNLNQKFYLSTQKDL